MWSQSPFYTSIPISSIFDLTISNLQTQSPTSSVDMELIHTTLVNSSSLEFMEKPNSESDHHLIDDLLDQTPIIFSTVTMSSAGVSLNSITTDSIVTSSTVVPSSSLTDLLHPLKSVCPSTDQLNSIHQLKAASLCVFTDDTHPLTTVVPSTPISTTTVVDHIIAQTL